MVPTGDAEGPTENTTDVGDVEGCLGATTCFRLDVHVACTRRRLALLGQDIVLHGRKVNWVLFALMSGGCSEECEVRRRYRIGVGVAASFAERSYGMACHVISYHVDQKHEKIKRNSFEDSR